MSNSGTHECKCGAIVEWRTSAKGNRYLAQLSHAYDNGARYNRGLHKAEDCAKRVAENEERAAANAAYRAKEEAARAERAEWDAVLAAGKAGDAAATIRYFTEFLGMPLDYAESVVAEFASRNAEVA